MPTVTNSKTGIAWVQIVIPLLTFVAGMFVQYVIANRTHAYQEFTTATTIATTDAAQKNKQLKEWADLVPGQVGRSTCTSGIRESFGRL